MLTVLPFPTVDPVLVELGPLAIRWYALAYIVGILLGWAYMRSLVRNDALWGGVRRPGLVDIDDFIMWGTLGIILGGRLGYVLGYNRAYYLANPGEILILWEGGMSFHGGLAGVTVAMILFARARRATVPVLSLFDVVAAATPIGLFFGRLANFINGELWGRPTDVPWAFVFPNAGPEPRHPSQLYEAALEGLVLFVVLRILTHGLKRLNRPGLVAGVFAAGYAAARIFVEFFRMPDVQVGFLAGGLTMGMALSIPMFLGGVWLILRARPGEPAPPEAEPATPGPASPRA